MATNTTNYNFKKPDESDFYSVQDQNNNWDKADTALKNLDTPTFEDYSGSTTAPDAATAINNIKSKGKLSTILSNMKAAFKGACLIGQIVNNCVTNNAKLPLSAAQGKALMDLYTQLNSDLNEGKYFRAYTSAFVFGKSIAANSKDNTFDFNISARGFATKPGIFILVPAVAKLTNIRYDYDNSTAQVAKIIFDNEGALISADTYVRVGVIAIE